MAAGAAARLTKMKDVRAEEGMASDNARAAIEAEESGGVKPDRPPVGGSDVDAPFAREPSTGAK